MKKHILASFTIAFFSLAFSYAQKSPHIKMDIQNTPPAAHSPVRLSSLDVSVEIMGNGATTTLDMIFVNETNRVLEGELEFPLAEGESIIGYALDINGKLRHGVVVEKDKGRQVFEAVVRQGIDPGLVEQTAGNNFKTRVYPLPAQGSRHIQISYQGELTEANKKSYYTFSALPPSALETFNFKITVLDSKAKPELQEHDSAFFTFNQMNAGYTASLSKKNYTLTKPITFELPEAEQNNAVVFTEDIGKDTYFYAYKTIEAARAKVAKPLPKSIVIYYDISDSAQKRDREKEYTFLEAYIQKLNAPLVTLVPFCNELYEARQFSGSARQIIDNIKMCLQDEGFDGATNLDYPFAELFPADEVLIFTDGIATWTDKQSNAAPLHTAKNMPRVYTINASYSAHHSWLIGEAQKGGGEYINLCTKNTDEALELILTERLRVIRAEYDKHALEDVFPQEGSSVESNFSVLGKLKRKEARITFHLGYGTTENTSISFTVSALDGLQTQHIARLWAAKKIDYLSMQYEENREQIIDIAKTFGIVTKDTSLIVLDSVQDYVRYGITPSEELKAEYERLAARQNTNKTPEPNTSTKIPQAVYTQFEAFRTWWNTSLAEFKKKKQPQKKIPQPRAPLDPIHPVEEAAVSADYYEAPLAAAAAPEVVMEVQEMHVMQSESVGRAAVTAQSRAANTTASAAPTSAQNKKGAEQSIQLTAWSAHAEYLSILKRTKTEAMFETYLELKKEYASSPAFYIEVSDYFRDEGLTSQSIRILSNLAEMELENTDILRALGNKLVEHNLYTLAVPIFEKLVLLREEIPQFYRDLGMAYYYAGYTQKAVDTLYSVAYKNWDGRFAEVQQIALNDMNAIIAAKKDEVDTSAIDKALLQNFDMDVRIILTWNTDNCDVDLWVTDSDGEKCYYGNKQTANGGRLSRDFTQGYGPEEFCIKEVPQGSLKIEANYFGNHQQKLLQPVTVQAEVYTNFGRPNQTREILTLQLDSIKQTFFIGTVR